jgi:chromosome segregation ATPase
MNTGIEGLPFWLFWLMLAVIIALSTLIFIRDKGIREGITHMFLGIRKKIHHAKINLQINKEKDEIYQLTTELGGKAWQLQLLPPVTDKLKQQLLSYQKDYEELVQGISALDIKINETSDRFAVYRTTCESSINEQEELKIPLLREFNRIKKECQRIDKNSLDIKKQKTKLEKKVISVQKKQSEVQADVDLSKIEKQSRTKELGDLIIQLTQELQQFQKQLSELNSPAKKSQSEIQAIKPLIAQYDDKIKMLKEELIREEKKYDSEKRKILLGIENLESKRKHSQVEGDLLLKKLGETLLINPIDNKNLTPIYVQIHRVHKSINRLEKRL